MQWKQLIIFSSIVFQSKFEVQVERTRDTMALPSLTFKLVNNQKLGKSSPFLFQRGKPKIKPTQGFVLGYTLWWIGVCKNRIIFRSERQSPSTLSNVYKVLITQCIIARAIVIVQKNHELRLPGKREVSYQKAIVHFLKMGNQHEDMLPILPYPQIHLDQHSRQIRSRSPQNLHMKQILYKHAQNL